jgi:hypothetical protein
LQQKKNLLVVLEEMGGKLGGIEILTVNRDTICRIAGGNYPARHESRDKDVIKTNVDTPKLAANLVCLDNKTITQVNFASYGDPLGNCGHFLGECNAPNSQNIVEQVNTVFLSFFSFSSLTHRHAIYVCIFLSTCNFLILIEQYCLGKTKCTVPVDTNIFDKQGNT